MKPFEVSRLRLDRAKEHGKSLAKIWNALPKGMLQIKFRADPRTGKGEVVIPHVDAVPDEFSLLLGEQLYQLRSALDACVYQAAIYATGQNPPSDEGKLEFPICSKPKDFAKQSRHRLSDLPQNLQDAIEKLQPYNMPLSLPPEETKKNLNRSLGILNDLARKDRHRKLHIVGGWPYHFDPKFTVLPLGVTVHNLQIMQPGLLQDGTVLATFQLKGFVAGMDIQVNPGLRMQIGCNEPPAPIDAGDTFDMRLVEMINCVHSVISAFETYF